MPIISIVNQKGGTGKTTTSMNLGSALAKLGKRVLVIDMDSQGNLGYSLGLDPGQTISDVFEGNATIRDIIQEREGMQIAPSDMRLVDIELSLIDLDDRHETLSSKIGTLSKSYDYILIDCPPSLSILAVNSLYASDQVIIPMLMEVLSLQGLDQIINTIQKINSSYDKKLEVMGILPVMVDKRRKLSEEVRDYINENYDVKIFNSMIRNNVKASEAPSFGQSVIEYSPSSNSAKDYMAFAEEIVKLN
ncbi:MAG: ParA family protein [Ekhidna sp.]|uniref:ParA family protein n=1 Tax=Ekhidna sp. TaxID=2608089 RepID=UPI0032EB8FD6